MSYSDSPNVVYLSARLSTSLLTRVRVEPRDASHVVVLSPGEQSCEYFTSLPAKSVMSVLLDSSFFPAV